MALAEPLAQDETYPIAEVATGLILNPDDRNLWFATPKGGLGYFEPRSPYANKVYPPSVDFVGTAAVAAWPGQGAWTVAWKNTAAVVAQVNQEKWTSYDLGSKRISCYALRVVPLGDGVPNLVIPSPDVKCLTFCTSSGKISYSTQFNQGGFHGLAVPDEEKPEFIWLSCPSGKSLVSFQIDGGKFSEPMGLSDAPYEITFDASGKYIWIATAKKWLFRYEVKAGTIVTVPSMVVPHHLFPAADGTLWFTSLDGDSIGYVPPHASSATVISTAAGTGPGGLAMDYDGRLWVSLSGKKALLRIIRQQLVPTSGEEQSAPEGELFAEPLAVKATETDGSAVKGATVTFTLGDDRVVEFENGDLTFTDDTDELGLVSSPPLRALKGGSAKVRAEWKQTEALALFRHVEVQETVGTPDHVQYISGAGQQAAVKKEFTFPMKVRVLDAKGQAVSGASVTFTIQGPARFPDGETEAVVDAPVGIATSPAFTATGKTGNVQVAAVAVDAVVSVTMSQTVTPA
ncbi:hypothetical protein ACIQKE_00145 [Streptomyces griseoviridis]|uniref:hypothetical protein n=1 Tax=Streptomyces TaxID=1883 RepID=UPI00247532A4|nr:hypothetical protein [Streptomyces sp. MAA16]MDH6699542.1 hypothetical protein [Streptomyces sp. MAA16]